ncbi:DUF4260 domain-containing protein [Streptomyces sp. NBC_01433]|uniref:DUF4260 domain-containing protein n=1 Tax=Streptomyces sp. NBC_01433 TaxID=2903864 RepID=UPI0022546449|nr:DUF4260 domain-containing protein [Streptomyces sp. NBC_01433]MCX4677578.1 DUF4260 domain-containing protein [Streptomyces sp. NBC_01433]
MPVVNRGGTAGIFPSAVFIASDLTMLAGDARGDSRGQLQARAVPYGNTVHRPLIPLAPLVAYPFVPLTRRAPIPAARCGRPAHISYDRAFGYGLRTKEGLPRD